MQNLNVRSRVSSHAILALPLLFILMGGFVAMMPVVPAFAQTVQVEVETILDTDITDWPSGYGNAGCGDVTVTGFETLNNEVVWIVCDHSAADSLIIAVDISGATPEVMDTYATGVTTEATPDIISYSDDQIIASFLGSSGYVTRLGLNAARDTIVEKARYTPGSTVCANLQSNAVTLDADGFLMVPCGSSDNVLMVNPSSMSLKMNTGSMTAMSPACDDVTGAFNDVFNNKIFAVCDTGNTLVSVSYTQAGTTYTAGTTIASQALGSVSTPMVVGDGFRQYVGVWSSTDANKMRVWSYPDSAASFSVVDAGAGSTLFGDCDVEPYASGLIIWACSSGSNTVDVFTLNSTDFNYGAVVTEPFTTGNTLASSGIGTNYVDVWVHSSGADTTVIGFSVIRNLNAAFPYTPLTPEELGETCDESDTDCDGVGDNTDNCVDDDNLNQTDTDGDGIGDVCDLVPGGTGSGVGTGNYNPGSGPNALINFATLNGFFSPEAAGLVLAALVHGALIAIPGLVAIKTGQFAPGYVWMFFFVLGGGLSLAMGFMPLLYFGIEMALIGLSLALVLSGSVRTGGGP